MQRPASGLVTAVEPVMRACAAPGSRMAAVRADRESADAATACAYRRQARRTPCGASGSARKKSRATTTASPTRDCGRCAISPMFARCSVCNDWDQYVAVNQRFADAVFKEAQSDDPVVLVQDYHFALLPALVREKLPKATIITFWHIPWPNPESFGICPWRREIIEGLLGSTILGFHTRFHCNNFLQTVDRFSRRASSTSIRPSRCNGHTLIESYPISIAWPSAAEVGLLALGRAAVAATCSARFGLPTQALLGLGVDRLDYTKGIVERLHAVERLLENIRNGSAASLSCRSRRRPVRLWKTTTLREARPRGPPTHQQPLRQAAGYVPVPADRTPRAEAGRRTLPCGGRVHGHQPA